MRKVHSAGELIADRYEIIKYVDEGGMQEVYLANDLNIGRNVALKTPKNLSASKRFRVSALASSKVNHVNVARTLDYFVFDDREYLIEEFVFGKTLGEVFSNEFMYLDPLTVAHVGLHLARGVLASHRVGVVHRDLKPSNIMVVGNRSFTNIKITDFGVAKLVDSEFERDEGGDVTGSIMASRTLIGAVPYMAPEVLLNGKVAPTLSSDIWAIGAILYHLLAGKTPYTINLAQVIISYSKREKYPPIPHLNSNFHLLDLSSGLIEIIEKCMAYEADNRPSAESLVSMFNDLCYTVSARYVGTVSNRRGYGNTGFGFINSETHSDPIFFHMDESFGDKPVIGDKVSFSVYPGEPRSRAFPILKCK